ncbi:hypothetical protein CONLIGDRAFT_626432 [Coniochaeta ligniaria NRRL 30616]|uniref:Zn(2)-C6 fungal-type domain-containing protein n=1 Tax=Coniochaeta ligniaria NRRL 30616 TaxID=1408157 RepID=A0A1J7J4N7_9PEZI|nr:hypothetical protein CONLIGDRAFT_626432 [Coniochaeta ligniaria NRRL 30616]
MNVDPQLRNHAAGDDASVTSTPAAQQDATQSPQQQHQHHKHATHHQQPPPPPGGTTYTSAPGQQAGGTTTSASFSPQTPNSAVSSLTNPPTNNNYPPSTAHDDGGPTPDHHHSFGTTPPGIVLGPGGIPLLDKKARACESCRGLKVRCEPDPSNPNPDDGPCRRCAKAGRACVVTQPTRKRQKKTDSRVAELEKKIDALTASLHATRGSGGSVGQERHNIERDPHAVAAGDWPGLTAAAGGRPPPSPWHGTATTQGAVPVQGPARALAVAHSPAMGQGPAKFGGMEIDFGSGNKAKGPPPMVMAGQKRKFAGDAGGGGGGSVGEDSRAASAPPVPPPSMGHEYSDCIDRAILSMDKANELWTRYTECMVPHLPGVVFPAGTTAAEIRKAKPVLFLSIMAVSSSELPSVQRTLTKELMQILADKVMVVGEKSLELVQALQVAVMWYWPPEHFEELKFYQLVHIAAVMAIDIGLGRKKSIMGGGLGLKKHIPAEWRQQHFKKHPLPDPTSVEARRAWLACYFLATNTSMALHRPNLIRWNSFMTECVDILESSPDAAPTDKYFCHLVWTHKLAEEVGIQFAMDDPSATINIADSRTQYALRGFERDLEKYSSSISEEFRQPSLMLSFHVLNLYMHEIATQPDNAEEWKQASTADQIRDALASDVPLTPAHINALSACLTAIDGVIEVFLSMEVSSIRCLPVFNFVRVAYAVVVLIKMYFAASSPKSELGKVINKDNMKVEQHLDNLLEKFGLTAASDKSRPASKFLVVLVMLRSWFQKQKVNEASDKPAQPAGTDYRTPNTNDSPLMKQSLSQDQTPHQQPDYSATANTPLQLLSEIATKDSNGTGSSTGPTPRPTPDFYWAGRQPQQPFIYDDTNSTSANTSSTPTNNTSGLTPGGAPANPDGPTGLLPYGPGSSSSVVGINWLDVAGFDYTGIGFGDGFAQAMDLTLTGIADGSMMSSLGPAGGWDGGGGGGNRYALQQDPAFLGALDGMGMGGGGGGGGGAPGNNGGGGGYQF